MNRMTSQNAYKYLCGHMNGNSMSICEEKKKGKNQRVLDVSEGT